MLGDDGAETVVVEVILLCELVGRALDDLEPVRGDTEGFEDGKKDESVVFCAVGDELERGLEVVEESVDICKQSVVRRL